MFANHPKVRLAGIPFLVTDLQDATSEILNGCRRHSPISIHLWNTYSVGLNAADPSTRFATGNPKSVFLPDGLPLAVIAKFMALVSGFSSARQVRGADLFRSVLAAGVDTKTKHAFYGSTPQTLDLLVAEAQKNIPGLIIADYFAPEFGPVTEKLADDISARIQVTQPDVVWLGMGTPKQDQLSSLLVKRVPICVIGVGAAFDFVASPRLEAPVLWRKFGLEWVHRLLSEPRRLWKRYSVGIFWFALALLGWKRND